MAIFDAGMEPFFGRRLGRRKLGKDAEAQRLGGYA